MTFYAFLPAYDTQTWGEEEGPSEGEDRVMAFAISEAEANAIKGALRVEVTSLSYLFVEGFEHNRFQFHGPRIPLEIYYEPPRPLGDYNDQDADGLVYMAGPSYVEHPESNWWWATEDIDIEFEFENWPPDGPRVGFVLQYEATAEMIYDWSYTWMNVSRWGRHGLQMRTNDPAGLGLSSFKIFTTGPGAPLEPFWAGLQNCAETV